MYAIIKTGGKQYKVSKGESIYIEKLDAKPNDKVTFEEVVFVNGKFGKPFVKGAKVVGKVEKQGKQKKIIIFKYKPKKKSTRKKMGHRQPYTKVLIEEIAV